MRKTSWGDELTVFGLYLDTRLHPSQFWDRKEDGENQPTLFALAGASERFDQWYQAEEGTRNDRPDIRLKLPPKFAAVIDELRNRDDDASRWIAFALLGLSRESVSKIEENIEQLRGRARSDGGIIRATFKDGDLAVSLVVAGRKTAIELQQYTKNRAILEKYRLGAGASVALGIHANVSSKPFDFSVWVEGPWEIDPVLENALAQDRPKLLSGQKLPGRNDPCICGSGKKFKRCCLGKISI